MYIVHVVDQIDILVDLMRRLNEKKATCRVHVAFLDKYYVLARSENTAVTPRNKLAY